MPKPTKGPRLGAGPAHERAIMRGLSRSLIIHGRVVTTEAKAKKVRPYVEKLITKARKGGLHQRRQALGEIGDRSVVHRLFADVAPRTGQRPGGYTRILKLGQRRGDGTPMAIIELVDHVQGATAPVAEEPKRRRGRRRKKEREPQPAADEDEQVPDEAQGAEEEPS